VAAVDLAGFPEVVDGLRAGYPGRPSVIVRGEDYDERRLWTIVAVAGAAGWPVYVWSSLPSVGRDRLGTRGIGGRTVLRVSPPSIRGLRAAQKRTLDVVGSSVGLALVAIPLAIGAVAIVVSSGRPVFYGQERVGRDGRRFRMWKLRTMRPGADSTGPAWTTEQDERRTKVGMVLRRFSLDELPQLWNVLKGDMSLVGPRPEQPFFAGRFEEQLHGYGFRHRIRPGLTGWAQAHGLRGDTSLDARVEFDNWYIEHWSPGLDLKILAQTLAEILRGRAY
jgi:exopolysaccharide biosynthesis polyprenyl glycosylphosphotransferase